MNLSWTSVLSAVVPLLLIAVSCLFVLKKPLRWLSFYVSAERLSFLHKHPNLLSYTTSLITAIVGILIFTYTSNYTLPQIYQQFKFLSSVLLRQGKYDTFFEEQYTDPTHLDFSVDKPRNLIVIFAESLEKTYFSQNLLPYLQKQSATSIIGYTDHDETNWTQSGLTAVLCGITSKLYMPPRSLSANLVCIPSVLSRFGYQTYYLQGTPLSFALAGDFLSEHGMQILEDIDSTRAEGVDTIYALHFINEVQSDSVLFSHFKNKIKALAADTRPFLAVTMTMNTHPHHGHVEKDCPRKYGDMRDAILCTDRQLNDFIEWFKAQDFAADTTLVIFGDHLMMYGDMQPHLNAVSNRETLNLVFSPDIPQGNIYKPFYQFDWAPTLLELAGFKWQNHQYGLGVSLISSTKTLREKYGQKGADRLLYNSQFYETVIKPK